MNQNNRQFTEVSGGAMGTPWNPRATEQNGMRYVPGDPGNMLQGYLKGCHPDIPTQYEKPMTLWTVQTVNPDGTLGQIFSIVEDSFLKDKLQAIPLGSYICIEYKGKTLKKGLPPQGWSKTNSYHTWFIGVDYNAIPMSQLSVGANGTLQANQQAIPVATSQAQTHQRPPVQQPPVYTPPVTQQQPPTHNPNQWAQQAQQFINTPPAQAQQFTPPPVQQQPQFTPPPVQQQQSFQAPPVQQQSVVPQKTFTPPPPQQQQFTPPPAQTTQQPAQNPQNGQFGGQSIVGNPFDTPHGDLPF